MRKFNLFLAFICLGILVTLSLYAPNSTPMWIASPDAAYIAVRTVMMAVLFALLVTNPPRNRYFRMVVGVLAVGIACWVFSTDTMKILDTISLLGTSAAMGVTVLEYNPTTGELLTNSSQQNASLA